MNPKAIITIVLVVVGAYTLVSCGIGYSIARIVHASPPV